MLRSRTSRAWGLAAVGALMAAAGACALNPQPLPPDQDDPGYANPSPSAGSSSSGSTGPMDAGATQVEGGQGHDAATQQDASIDAAPVGDASSDAADAASDGGHD